MTTVERIKLECKKQKYPVYKLERDCGFGNGYFNSLKSGEVPFDRLLLVSDKLNVTMGYLLVGDYPTPEKATIAAEAMFNPYLPKVNEMFLELSSERQRDIYNYVKMIYDNEVE